MIGGNSSRELFSCRADLNKFQPKRHRQKLYSTASGSTDITNVDKKLIENYKTSIGRFY